MKNLFLIIVATLSIVSCGDVEQTLVIEADGTVNLSTGSNIFDMLDDVDTQSPSSKSAIGTDMNLQNLVESLSDYEKLDTTIYMHQMSDLDSLTENEKELMKDLRVHIQIDKANELAKMILVMSSKSKESQLKKVTTLMELMQDESDDNNLAEMIVFDYDLNLQLGELVIHEYTLPEQYNLASQGMKENPQMALNVLESMAPGSYKKTISVPGKILSINGDSYQIINDHEVVYNMSFAKLLLDGKIPSAVIQFEPTEPITDPKTTEVWEPEPEVVTPGKKACQAPSDAIVLFDGNGSDEWAHEDGRYLEWQVKKKHMTVTPGAGAIKSKREFGDIQLHIEWRSPKEPTRVGQDKGNSGIFFQDKYEVQILNSYQNRTYSNGQAASVYKQHAPLVNAMNPPGEWNVYDIVFHAPKFDTDGAVINKGTLTVLHNGVLVQDHVEILGTTEYIGRPKTIPHGPAPLKLQDHSNEVSFRNIWVREL